MLTEKIIKEYFDQRKALLSSYEKAANALEAEVAKVAEELTEKSASLTEDAKTVIRKMPPVIDKLIDLFGGQFTFASPWLTADGRRPDGKVADKDCLDTCESDILRLLTLLKKTSESGDPDRGARAAIAESYNRIVSFLYRTEEEKTAAPIAAAQKKIRDDVAAKKEALDAFDRKNDALRREIEERGATFEQMEVEFSVRATLDGTSQEAPNLPMAYVKSDKYYLDVLRWDMSEKNTFYVECDNYDDVGSANVTTFIENVVIRFLQSYSGANVRVAFCDTTNNAGLQTFADRLYAVAPKLVEAERNVTSAKTPEAIKATLQKISTLIGLRNTLCDSNGKKDIFEYNRAMPDDVNPPLLVVINGYPWDHNLYNNEVDHELDNLIKNGRKVGVYCLIVGEKRKPAPSYALEKVKEVYDGKRYSIKREAGEVCLVSDGKSFRTISRVEGFDVNRLFDALKARTADANRPVSFDELMASVRRDPALDFSRSLRFPIGKAGGKTAYVQMDSNRPTSHAMIIGRTGSGKTSLLFTTVLSLAEMYSPKELEMHLFGLVKTDLKVFYDSKLPHLKTIFTGENMLAAEYVLRFLVKEMRRRFAIMGGMSISDYNDTKPEGEKLPRALIMIDEFQKILEVPDGQNLLRDIATQGRACGISLVLATQFLPPQLDVGCVSQFAHRFEYENDTQNLGELIKQEGVKARAGELQLGSCFYSLDGRGLLSLVKVAYCPQSSISEKVEEIRAKYPDAPFLANNDEQPRHIMNKNEDIPFVNGAARDALYSGRTVRLDHLNYSMEEAREAFAEGLRAPIRLGEQYLSREPMEYAFDCESNRTLILMGDYAALREAEAAIINDVIYFSGGMLSVLYVNQRENRVLARAHRDVSKYREAWTETGSFAYFDSENLDGALSQIEALIEERNDEEASIHPVVVMLTACETFLEKRADAFEDTFLDKLKRLMGPARDANINFVFSFGSVLVDSLYSLEIPFDDGIILPPKIAPDRGQMYDFFTCFSPSREDSPVKTLLKAGGLPENAGLLCDNNHVAVFIKHERTAESFQETIDLLNGKGEE